MKAGSLDRQQVETLVGGRAILDALLAMDLDALHLKLTGPAPAGGPRSASSPWHQILTNGETAPPPPPDPALPLDFGDLATGDTHTRALRVTALADGMVEARVPTDSLFQVLSMTVQDGVILEQPAGNRFSPSRGHIKSSRAQEVARQQPPWWRRPEPLLDLVADAYYNQSIPYTFVVPLLVSSPNPAVNVQGTVTPLSLPPGVSMPSFSFFLGPNQTRDLSFTMAIDRFSAAYTQMEVQRQFSLRVSYKTLSAPLASRTEDLNLAFTLYPGSQSWSVSAKVGGVQCEESLHVLGTGETTRSGWCTNANAYTAKVTADGTLAQVKLIQAFYSMGWFDGPVFSFGPTQTIPSFKKNYLWVREQPLLVAWTKY